MIRNCFTEGHTHSAREVYRDGVYLWAFGEGWEDLSWCQRADKCEELHPDLNLIRNEPVRIGLKCIEKAYRENEKVKI